MDLDDDVSHYEVSKRLRVELVARGLSLHLPDIAVGVEDSSAEEIVEEGNEPVAFWVVLEVCLEHVFHV